MIADTTDRQQVVAFMKGIERYIFVYERGDEQTVYQTLGRFAGDARLSLSWWDAAVLTQRIREREKGGKDG